MYKIDEIVKKSLLVGDKFMPKMVLLIVLVVHSPETKKELKGLCREETQILFTETSLIKLVFNMIWFTASQKTLQKELNQTKF